MLSTKNLSPRQLSVLTAIVLALSNSILFYFVDFKLMSALFAFIGTFIGSYILISWVLEWFIYRKIKLIYKFIYQTKANKREEMYYQYILPKKGIDDVREDVEKWAEQRSSEIANLRKNEAFRKEFLQNLSHEFKTPVFAIQGYIETLLNGEINNPEVNVRFLTNAFNNVNRLGNLLIDLDEIVSLEMGQQPLYKQSFIIQDLIKEIMESLTLRADSMKIKCSIKKGCEFPISVFADKEKIRQVLNNLFVNAIKYGKYGGTTTVGIYKTDGERVLIELSDDGIGIAEQHLSRVFERFFRTDKSRSRNVGGTGLGLAICKHIIEAHGQTIHVRSKLYVGSTFGFTLSTRKDD